MTENATSTDHFGFSHRWIFAVTGFADRSHPLYSLYRTGILLLNSYILAMSLYAAYLGSSDINTVIEAVHIAAGVVCTSGGLMSRLATGRSIRRLLEMVRTGLDQYEDEGMQREIIDMKSRISREIDRKIKFIGTMYLLSFLSNMVYFPLCKQYFFPQDLPTGDLNFYLPHLLYYPFDTTTPFGYACAYLIDFVFFFFLYMTAVNMISIYVFCAVQLKVNLRMLNISLRNIEKRALSRYVSSGGSRQGFFSSPQFQDCLYRCLKANARHHQALVRFKKESQPFIGIILLITFTLAAIIYATVLYLISQKPPFYVIVHLAITNVAEQIYVLYIGVFGEQIIQESSNLFVQLYDIPWFRYDERFKQTLDIMMNNTRKPMILKATFMEADASMESYGDLLTTMYKLMSIVRKWTN